MVVLGPLGSEPSVSADSTTRASKWCSVSESNRSLALEGRGVSPETQRNVAIVRRLELRKPGLRGLLLEPLCIHDHVGGAHRNRTDQAICLQGKSGSLARTPEIRSCLRQPLVRFAFTGRVYRQLHGLVPPGGLEPPSHRLRGGTLAR